MPKPLQLEVPGSPRQVLMTVVADVGRRRHWHLVSQGNDGATFRFYKGPNMLLALGLMVCFVLPGLVYLIISRKSETLTVMVGPAANSQTKVQITANGGYGRGVAKQLERRLRASSVSAAPAPSPTPLVSPAVSSSGGASSEAIALTSTVGDLKAIAREIVAGYLTAHDRKYEMPNPDTYAWAYVADETRPRVEARYIVKATELTYVSGLHHEFPGASRLTALEFCNGWNTSHKWPLANVVDVEDHTGGFRIWLRSTHPLADLSQSSFASIFDAHVSVARQFWPALVEAVPVNVEGGSPGR